MTLTPQEKSIQLLLSTGKNYGEICKLLNLNKQSLYIATYRMRKKGIQLMQQNKIQNKLNITPKQREVLHCYMEKMPVHEIAALLHITAQTVLNHAAQGFARLGLTTPGQDRIAALKTIFGEPKQQEPITMDDPFFN